MPAIENRRNTPLFLPLLRRDFEAFRDGAKTREYRVAGPHWNARTCIVGREIILSLGYSGERMRGEITDFREVGAESVPEDALKIYPDAEVFAEISIRVKIFIFNPKKKFR